MMKMLELKKDKKILQYIVMKIIKKNVVNIDLFNYFINNLIIFFFEF